MDKVNPVHEHERSETPELDVSLKLTPEDIERIEQYRQTRKTSVLTILFTDIVGFTGFTFEAGEVASAKFRHIHDEIILGQLHKEGHGEVVKQIGDSFLIVFSDPTLAVKFALKLQELFRINAENLTYHGYTLKIRIGLHMGQVSVEDHLVSDIFGNHVNIASRVMSLAGRGQVLVSGSVWENASGWLKDDREAKVLSVFYGKAKLKGVGKATEVYEFYSEKDGKTGMPKQIKKQKQKTRLKYAILIAILIVLLTVPAFMLLIKVSKNITENGSERRDLVYLADISTDTLDFQGYYFESVQLKIIIDLNETYYSLLKTNFISDFEVLTDLDLKAEYAKQGKPLPKGIQFESIFQNLWRSKYRMVSAVRPYLFKNKVTNGFTLRMSII